MSYSYQSQQPLNSSPMHGQIYRQHAHMGYLSQPQQQVMGHNFSLSRSSHEQQAIHQDFNQANFSPQAHKLPSYPSIGHTYHQQGDVRTPTFSQQIFTGQQTSRFGGLSNRHPQPIVQQRRVGTHIHHQQQMIGQSRQLQPDLTINNRNFASPRPQPQQTPVPALRGYRQALEQVLAGYNAYPQQTFNRQSSHPCQNSAVRGAYHGQTVNRQSTQPQPTAWPPQNVFFASPEAQKPFTNSPSALAAAPQQSDQTIRAPLRAVRPVPTPSFGQRLPLKRSREQLEQQNDDEIIAFREVVRIDDDDDEIVVTREAIVLDKATDLAKDSRCGDSSASSPPTSISGSSQTSSPPTTKKRVVNKEWAKCSNPALNIAMGHRQTSEERNRDTVARMCSYKSSERAPKVKPQKGLPATAKWTGLQQSLLEEAHAQKEYENAVIEEAKRKAEREAKEQAARDEAAKKEREAQEAEIPREREEAWERKEARKREEQAQRAADDAARAEQERKQQEQQKQVEEERLARKVEEKEVRDMDEVLADMERQCQEMDDSAWAKQREQDAQVRALLISPALNSPSVEEHLARENNDKEAQEWEKEVTRKRAELRACMVGECPWPEQQVQVVSVTPASDSVAEVAVTKQSREEPFSALPGPDDLRVLPDGYTFDEWMPMREWGKLNDRAREMEQQPEIPMQPEKPSQPKKSMQSDKETERLRKNREANERRRAAAKEEATRKQKAFNARVARLAKEELHGQETEEQYWARLGKKKEVTRVESVRETDDGHDDLFGSDDEDET